MPATASFRPAHEARAAVAWLLALVHCGLLAWLMRPDARLMAALASACFALAVWRATQARALWRFRLRLAGQPTQRLSSETFDRGHHRLRGDLWLGWGFRWQPPHTQLCHDGLKRPLHQLYPPGWFLRLHGARPDPAASKGLAWVHGLDREHDVVVPFAALEGHTAVLAVTGALKTVLARLLVYQLARRGDTVIVLDPKGDKDLEAVCRDVASKVGDPGRFLKFHPAFASSSFRFDALAGWDRDTQVASRIRLLMGGGPDDHFTAFVWMTVTDIVRAMTRVGQRVTLRALLDTVRSQQAAEALAERVLRVFLIGAGLDPDPPRPSRSGDAGGSGGAEGPRGRNGVKPPRHASATLTALIAHYQALVPPERRPSDITGLLAALEANREWFAKMIVGLTPLLTRLTAGDLGPLLSPDPADFSDDRPIHTTRSLIEGRHIVYFGLDALSDTSVAEGLAALVLADLAGTAGDLYNRAAPGGTPPRKVHVLCDEWGDLVCEPVISWPTRGAGSASCCTCSARPSPTWSSSWVTKGGPNASSAT